MPSRSANGGEGARLSAFTSADAHNGCRALFNGTAGWAYFGPAGSINPAALPPGTVSVPYHSGRSKGRGSSGFFLKREDGGRPPAKTSPAAAPRPGEHFGRKSDDTRGWYLDAEDLRSLMARGDDSEGGCFDGGAGTGAETGAPRKGRPIVLTLQAILAATSPDSPPAAAVAAGDEAADAGDAGGSRTGGVASPPPPPVAVADRAQFPPLLLRGASAEKGPGLFLAPPITMVKNQSAGAGAVDTSAAGPDDASDGCGSISCSEAVAATSVAEAATAVGGGSDDPEAAGGGEAGATGVGGMSRIGWWLRWATTPAAAPTGAEADVASLLETSNGAEGWQVVSSPAAGGASLATPVAAAPTGAGVPAETADETGDDDEVESWCDFAAEEIVAGDTIGGDGDEGSAPMTVLDGAGGAHGVEAALKRAASGTVYDDGSNFAGGADDSGDEHGAEVYAADNANINSGVDGGDDGGVPQDVSPNVPLSFRDTLMAPSATGAVGFSDPKAAARSRAAAAAGPSSSSPALVDGGVDGGAVFLWKKAAAGEGGRAADRGKGPVEDEDPYYARKRVGAFAFRTKPRGKAHK